MPTTDSGTLPHIIDDPTQETFQDNEDLKLRQKATADGKLRVTKAGNVEEASHN